MDLRKIWCIFFPKHTEALLKDDSYYIDMDFFDRLFRGKYLLGVKKKKVKVSLLKRQIDKKIYTLYESNLYKYLENRDTIEEKDERFEKLIENIETHGFDPKSIIVCKYKSNLIKDGQHRAIYMLWKYGPDFEVDTLHVRVKGDLLRFKLFPWLKKFCPEK